VVVRVGALNRDFLRSALGGLGYELVDFEVARGGHLRIFLDKPEGITVDDCALVSHHLTRLFAVEAIDYERLEISSPGLDRPLFEPGDYERFAGQLAKIKLHAPLQGRKKWIGRIGPVTEGKVALSVEEQGKPAVVVEVRFDDIEKARLEPEF
jgi:ribosome maturation factor RimP